MVALFSRTLRPSWEFTPGTPIWRLHPPVEGRIIGEVRDPEGKRAMFFALDAATGKCLWRDKTLHDPWWVAIERVTGDKLLLHGYVAPDFPVLHGITVVDIPTGAVVWSDPEWSGDEAALAAAGIELHPAHAGEEPVFPVSADPHDPGVQSMLAAAGWAPGTIDGPVEFAEQRGRIVAAAHVGTGTGQDVQLTHRLVVLDPGPRRVLFAVTLVAAAKGVAPDAFFLSGGILYYIRERTTLCALRP